MTNETIKTVRTITNHAVDPANEKLTITVRDAPGQGGASHLYLIEGFDTISNFTHPVPGRCHPTHLHLLFQNGLIPEVGVNGITNESLLAIVADRLRGFQSGPYACRENACALIAIEEAMHWLKQRTIERIHRGVEGTHEV